MRTRSMLVGFVLLATSGWAAAPAGRFVVAAQTVRDVRTGLTWERAEAPAAMTLADAVAYCTGLSLDGQGGWRMPRFKELMTLIDPREPLRIDPVAFPGTTNSYYWTSTPCVTSASCPSSNGMEYQYAVRFTALGMMGTLNKNTTTAANIKVRCVR